MMAFKHEFPATAPRYCELYALLAADGGRVPDGFALTACAYREALATAGAVDKLRPLFADLDHHDVSLLVERAAAARHLVYEATGNPSLCHDIATAYRPLEKKYGTGVAVAARSSATPLSVDRRQAL